MFPTGVTIRHVHVTTHSRGVRSALASDRMKRSLIAALAGSLVLLAGCGGSDGGSSGGAQAPAVDSPMSAPGAAFAPEADSVTRQAPQPADRKEVVTGQIFVTASDPVEAARRAVEVVEDAGGRIDNRTENPATDNTPASSSLTARIPAAELTATVDSIEALGKVTSVSISRDDVTMQYQDLDARIGALQASVDRLRALIAGAGNTADLIEAESALSSRQGELDSLTSQKNYLADQVELSTITVQFSTDDVTPSPGPDNFVDGLIAGWHSLVDALQDGVVALGRAIPWLGALFVGAGLVYAVVRVVGSRTSPSRAADISQEPVEPSEPEASEPETKRN